MAGKTVLPQQISLLSVRPVAPNAMALDCLCILGTSDAQYECKEHGRRYNCPNHKMKKKRIWGDSWSGNVLTRPRRWVCQKCVTWCDICKTDDIEKVLMDGKWVCLKCDDVICLSHPEKIQKKLVGGKWTCNECKELELESENESENLSS